MTSIIQKKLELFKKTYVSHDQYGIMEEFRGFIAMEIPVNTKLQGFLNDLKQTGAIMKTVEPENLHITLKFLGQTKTDHINQINKIIMEAVEDIEPFNIELSGTGVFPNLNYIKIIWVGIKNASNIIEIANRIDNNVSNLGYKKEKRSFSPHLTISRMKNIRDGKEKLINLLNENQNTFFDDININSIILKKSTLTPKGPIYESIKEIFL